MRENNPAHEGHWISQPMRIVEPLPFFLQSKLFKVHLYILASFQYVKNSIPDFLLTKNLLKQNMPTRNLTYWIWPSFKLFCHNLLYIEIYALLVFENLACVSFLTNSMSGWSPPSFWKNFTFWFFPGLPLEVGQTPPTRS